MSELLYAPAEPGQACHCGAPAILFIWWATWYARRDPRLRWLCGGPRCERHLRGIVLWRVVA